jgi:hydroxymethylglutaryl-CoA lyase
VRGYVSTVITCPYDGETDPRRVRDVTKALVQMGCYEVSLGDTVGTGTPTSVQRMLNEVVKDTKVEMLAVSGSFDLRTIINDQTRHTCVL